MEAWGLGVLGLSFEQLEKVDFDWLIKAWNGYRKDRQELWEMHRLSGYLAFIGFQGSEKHNHPRKLWRFGWEEQNEVLSKIKLMTRQEAIAHYKEHGVKLEDWQLERMKFKEET